MANPYFQFKKFLIHQDSCGMKVSTDAVVLGALALHDKCSKILDIGTGTGVIALMLAQRFHNLEIHAVEIDKAAFDQATHNVSNSPWKLRITLYHQSFQDFVRDTKGQFDFIVSNPPYFPAHIKSENHQRNLALHNDALPFRDLVDGVASLLAPNGLFWVILPERQMRDLEKLVIDKGLFPHRRVLVRNHPAAPVLRVVQAFSFLAHEPTETTLTIRGPDLNYSLAYKELLRDFLLDF